MYQPLTITVYFLSLLVGVDKLYTGTLLQTTWFSEHERLCSMHTWSVQGSGPVTNTHIIIHTYTTTHIHTHAHNIMSNTGSIFNSAQTTAIPVWTEK